MPRTGSFADAVLNEVDTRKRDIRYYEMLLLVKVFTLAVLAIMAMLKAGLHLKGEDFFTEEKVQKLLDIYRDKLFHFAYLPDYERRFAAAMNTKSSAMQERTEKELQALAKLDELTDHEPM